MTALQTASMADAEASVLLGVDEQTPIIVEQEQGRGGLLGRLGAGAALIATAGALGIPVAHAQTAASTVSVVERSETSRATTRWGGRISNNGRSAMPTALDNSPRPRATVKDTASQDDVKRDAGLPSHGRVIEQIAAWLQVSDGDVAELVGVSRRTVVNWRAGRGGYGATTRRLFATHALLSQLIAKEGLERAQIWLHSPGHVGTKSRLQLLASGSEGLSAVLGEAEPLLFPISRPTRHDVDDPAWDDVASTVRERELSAAMINEPPRPDDFTFEPRRPRRA